MLRPLGLHLPSDLSLLGVPTKPAHLSDQRSCATAGGGAFFLHNGIFCEAVGKCPSSESVNRSQLEPLGPTAMKKQDGWKQQCMRIAIKYRS